MSDSANQLIELSTRAANDAAVLDVVDVLKTIDVSIDNIAEWPLRLFLDQLPFILYIKDIDGRFVYANREALRQFRADDLDTLRARSFEAGMTLNAVESLHSVEATVLRGGRFRDEIEIENPQGSQANGWLFVTVWQLRDGKGKLVGLVGAARDITLRRRAEFLRRGHAALLEQIARGYPLETTLDGIARLAEAQLIDIYVSILYYDEKNRSLRHGAAPSIPADYAALIDGIEIGEKVGSCGTAAFRREPVFVCDIQNDPLWADYVSLVAPYGWRSCWSTPIIDATGTLFGTVALYSRSVRSPCEMEREVTAMATDLAAIAIGRARSEERFRHMANHDALTGLPNRRHFLEQFAEAIDDASVSGKHLALAYFDLNDFKRINDTLGHGVGDEVLCTIARRLTSGVRTDDLAVRLGGDEFAVLMTCEAGGDQQLVARLDTLRASLGEPMVCNGHKLVCGGSTGIAFYPENGETPDALLAFADAQMYLAKKDKQSKTAPDSSLRLI